MKTGFLPSWRRVKVYGAIFGALFAFKAVWVLLFRFDGRALVTGGERTNLMARRAYLVERMSGPTLTPKAMPGDLHELYQGEWALVTYSMATAGLVNLAFLYPETRAESLQLVPHFIDAVLKRELASFDTVQWHEEALAHLDKVRGHIGYLGHLGFMLAAYRYLGGDGRYADKYEAIVKSLSASLEAAPLMCAQTYPGEVYIPDNTVVVATLGLHDKADPAHATGTARRWFAQAGPRLRDPKTGLLVFSLDVKAKPAQLSRGSGSTWDCFYLGYADPAFTSKEYARARQVFLSRPLPLVTGFREYPPGVDGAGDVDSGPVILGLSLSGTGFAVGCARMAGDAETVNDLLFTAELAGFTWQWNGAQRYLLSPLVGDAIMLAMQSATTWDTRWVH
jgi:hypothetical protein